MGFVRPALLLLLVPALWVWWRTRESSRATQAVRLLCLAALVLALAAPYMKTRDDGRDLVMVVDRSLSMPREGERSALELVRLAEKARRSGDRLAVVSFGGRAAIEALPSETGVFAGFERDVDADASDLGEALDASLNLVPEGRRGSILVLSDGESNGRDPIEAARRAFARGIRVDVRPVPRPPVADLSVERIDLPEEVSIGEPFQFSVWVQADARSETEFVLSRRGEVLSRGKRVFEPGLNRLLFRDVVNDVGVVDYAVHLETEGDRIEENDRGLGALHVRGPRPLLILNDDGREDSLSRVMRLAGVPVDVRAPQDLRLDPLALYAWRGVVLENVSAPRLGTRGMDALQDFVLERGGGLLMTGGKGAFGVGGYHLTAVDEILPVSMELRQEHRKQGVALVIVLDRSGSMSARVGGDMTKMDLANRGAAAAIELLSMIDAVGVIAVDSSSHVVQDLTPVQDVPLLTAKVKTIESMGGGIYVYTGLLAAGRMLERASHVNRHIILFADAADSEEQGGVPELVDRLAQMGTTVSVIALGTEADGDARFLKETAARGGGEVYFTVQAEELPRLFAQDTLMVARSTFIEEDTPVETRPDLFGMGDPDALSGADGGFPVLEGYNLNYLREGAIAGAVTKDEYRAPIVAFWNQGLGRTAAVCAQVGGSFGERLVLWPGFSSFFVTLARWLVGAEEPSELFPTVRREGDEVVVTVEVDPDAPVPVDTANLAARLRRPDGVYTDHLLERTGETTYEARVELDGAGITLGTLRLPDGRFKDLPPLVLPYSPEFERARDPQAGEELLRRIARETGGEVAPPAHTLFRGEREAFAHRVISRELILSGLLVLMLEIAARRLGLWSALDTLLARLARRPAPANADEPAPARGRKPKDARRAAAALEKEPAEARVAPPQRRTGSVGSALERARTRAGRRLDR